MKKRRSKEDMERMRSDVKFYLMWNKNNIQDAYNKYLEDGEVYYIKGIEDFKSVAKVLSAEAEVKKQQQVKNADYVRRLNVLIAKYKANKEVYLKALRKNEGTSTYKEFVNFWYLTNYDEEYKETERMSDLMNVSEFENVEEILLKAYANADKEEKIEEDKTEQNVEVIEETAVTTENTTDRKFSNRIEKLRNSTETEQIKIIEQRLTQELMTCCMDTKLGSSIMKNAKKAYFDYIRDTDSVDKDGLWMYITYMHCRLAGIRRVKRECVDVLDFSENSFWDAYIKVFLVMSNMYLPEKVFQIDKRIIETFDKLKIPQEHRKIMICGLNRRDVSFI